MRSADRFSRRFSLVTLLVTGLVLTGGVAFAATPVSGRISGEIVSLKSATSFVVKDSFGPVAESTVSLTKSSSVIEQVTASRSALKAGACVSAMGSKASSGTIDASRITISAAVKGSCSTGFSGHGRPGGSGSPPAGAPSGHYPSAGSRGSGGFNFGDFGFAFGSITKVSGSTLTVKGTSGTEKVALSGSTSLLEMKHVGHAAIKADECANVSGTSANEGATVAATSVSLSQPSSSGCGFGFGGRP